MLPRVEQLFDGEITMPRAATTSRWDFAESAGRPAGQAARGTVGERLPTYDGPQSRLLIELSDRDALYAAMDAHGAR